MSKYLDWMLRCQGVDGSVTNHVNASYIGEDDVAYYRVEPYFASLGLIWAMRSHPANVRGMARDWLTWWFRHRDAASGSALIHYCTLDRSVSVTDVPGSGLPANHEDATDSNIALWYVLLDEYTQHFGSSDLPTDLLDGIHEPLIALRKVIDSDGLTWAREDFRLKYLMDNVEVWAGVRSAQNVLQHTAKGISANVALAKWADDYSRNIQTSLAAFFDRRKRSWSVYQDEAGAIEPSDLRTAYPHINAQVWPMLFGMDARGGLETVEGVWPHWMTARQSLDTKADIHIALAAAVEKRFVDLAQWLSLVAPLYEEGDDNFHGALSISEVGMLHYIFAKTNKL